MPDLIPIFRINTGWISLRRSLPASGSKGKEKLPSLLTMQVPNDHGAGIRPADGYYYPHSFMVDNDLAVGRILHFSLPDKILEKHAGHYHRR